MESTEAGEDVLIGKERRSRPDHGALEVILFLSDRKVPQQRTSYAASLNDEPLQRLILRMYEDETNSQ